MEQKPFVEYRLKILTVTNVSYHMTVTWLSHGSHMVLTWFLHGSHMLTWAINMCKKCLHGHMVWSPGHIPVYPTVCSVNTSHKALGGGGGGA